MSVILAPITGGVRCSTGPASFLKNQEGGEGGRGAVGLYGRLLSPGMRVNTSYINFTSYKVSR